LQLLPRKVNKKKNLKQPPKKAVSQPVKPQRDYSIFLLWVVIGIVSIIRYRLISIPFERDEGEYGYIGNLLLHGVAPYKDAYSMKLPGTSFMYAIFMLFFGHTNSGVHLGMVFINAATMYFLFSAFKKIFHSFIGLATATIYGSMAISWAYFGVFAHATHFICFYSSIALLFLADYMKSGKMLKVFLCGLMFGMAFLMKQQAIFLILFGGLILFLHLKTEKNQSWREVVKNLFLFGAGIVIPYFVVLLIILLTGQFSIFWLWTVDYASKYESIKDMALITTQFSASFIRGWNTFYYIILAALGGMVVLLWSSYSRLQKIFVITYLIANLCILSSGFYFRPHYFIVTLPAIGLLSGIFIEFICKKIRLKSSNIPLLILFAIILYGLYDNRKEYFTYTPRALCDMIYAANPFDETQEIAKYIKEDTKDTDKIAILGSEPEICFYADRRSATGYLYTYPLVEKQPYNEMMQEQMIKEIEKNTPAYLVYFNNKFSWGAQPGTPTTLLDWANKYIPAHYTQVGIGDYFSNGTWQTFWGDDIKNAIPNPQSSFIVLKRNPAARS